MDLSNLDTVAASGKGAVMEVRHPVTKAILLTTPTPPKDKGDPVTLTIIGFDATEFRDHERALINKRLNGGKSRQTDAEAIQDEAITVLAMCVKAWSGIEVDGKQLDCTPANVKMVLNRFPWLKEQVDAFVGDRANFLPV